MAAVRIASRINLLLPLESQRAKSTTAAVERPVVFTTSQLQDDTQHVKQLQALSQQVAQITQAHRSHPEQAPITFDNVSCGQGGSRVRLHHGFGVNAEYTVTKWKAYVIRISSSTDATPIVVTTNGNHQFYIGQLVRVSGHKVNVAANGDGWIVSAATGNTVTLTGSVGSGAGAGTATGTVSTASAPVLVCDENDPDAASDGDTLVLRSNVAGVATIRVYPGG